MVARLSQPDNAPPNGGTSMRGSSGQPFDPDQSQCDATNSPRAAKREIAMSLEVTVCRVCGASGKFDRCEVREMNFGSREAFWYLKCAHCDSLQIDEIPNDLGRHYPSDYLGSGPSVAAEKAASLRASLRKFLRVQRTAYLLNGLNALGWIAQRVREDECTPHLLALRASRISKEARILDVGCGPGHLLRRLREAGFAHLAGQDPFHSWAFPGIEIHSGPLHDVAGQYDLIMLHHSLEHTSDPLQMLVEAKMLCSPSGLILVRIPVAAGEAWTTYGVDWYQIDAPRHLVIPSARGMQELAQRAGLRISNVDYDSDETQFLCSEQYKRDISLRDGRSYYHNPHQALFAEPEIANAKARAQAANRAGTGDQACFYLRAPRA